MERISVREISERLTAQAEAVARELLPDGRRSSSEWYASSSKSPLGYAISVVLNGRKRGVVLFTAGTSTGKSGGDLLDLATEIYGSKRAAVEWAKGFLGISDDRPEQSEAARKAAERKRKEREREDARRAQRKRLRATDIWRAGVPISGTLAETYLLKRGIAPSDWPASLRFAPSLEWELGRVRSVDGWAAGPAFPALVAAVQAPTRDLVAVWRIYLDAEGNKAPLDPCKVGLGPAKGGAVRFGPDAETIGVAEGIETALALRHLVDGLFPIWATLSTSGMATLDVPPGVKEVRIFADSDRERINPRTGETIAPAGIRAAEALEQRLKGMGVRAVIERDALPEIKEDYLDILNKVR